MAKLSFMPTMVVAQRGATETPELFVTSTKGGFRLNPRASSLLGIGARDFVTVYSTRSAVEGAIAMKDAAIVAHFEENGLNIEDPLDQEMVIKEFTQFFISKGVALLEKNGNPQTYQQRLTSSDKEEIVKHNFDDYLAAVANSDNEELKNAIAEAPDMETKVSILSELVVPMQFPKFTGSLTAGQGGRTGIGITLTFTDSTLWVQMKSDLEDPESVNRKFIIDVTSPIEIPVDNGLETVNVRAFPLSFEEDMEVIARTKKSEESVESEGYKQVEEDDDEGIEAYNETNEGIED